jgi:hypothetical protein
MSPATPPQSSKVAVADQGVHRATGSSSLKV